MPAHSAWETCVNARMSAGHDGPTADLCTIQLAAASATLASTAMSAIIKKKFAFAMPLQKPPRKPARMSPGSVAANQMPIMSDAMGAGASFEISASPTGAR